MGLRWSGVFIFVFCLALERSLTRPQKWAGYNGWCTGVERRIWVSVGFGRRFLGRAGSRTE